MTIRAALLTAATLAGSIMCFGATSGARVTQGPVHFDESVHFYSAAGPVAIQPGQSAQACATTLRETQVSIFLGLLDADNGALLASQQVALQPGTTVCISANGAQQQGPMNVTAVLLKNGRLTPNGEIVQDAPGGGCIFGSVQIQATPNNTPGQTILYAPMLEHLIVR
jgi:hypothetical protein